MSRSDVEGLLDYWYGPAKKPSIDPADFRRLEEYNFRDQETFYNDRLPQSRAVVELPRRIGEATGKRSPRVHFVHKRSSVDNAIPLLLCPDWGSGFIEVARVVDSLCEPVTTPPMGHADIPAFHVVCPSIPGFGFSDMSQDVDFGIEGTAELFLALMHKLGYKKFLAFGSRW